MVERKQKGKRSPLTGGPGGPIVISISSGWSDSVSFSSLYNHPNILVIIVFYTMFLAFFLYLINQLNVV